jgi:tetratricopeptide (TPR) repeat protein
LKRLVILGTLLAAGCATTSHGVTGAASPSGPAVPQLDAIPPPASLPEGPDRDALAAAQAREAKGDAAGTAHEQARTEWAAAGAAYADLAARPAFASASRALRLRAAELLLRAQRWDRAEEVATALANDAQAGDPARAVGARLAATAAIGAANAAVKAGQLDKLDLGTEKKGAARPPPPAWRRVVETADAYLARAGADVEPRRAPSDRRLSGPEIALVAAEVQYAHGELDDARRRLDAALERWPGEPDLLEQAVPLYLATYRARGDRPGELAAVERLRARVDAEASRAPPERKPGYARVLETLARARSGGRFAEGEELLKQKKPADAAKAFEAAAAEPGAPDVPGALHNAAVAWEQAGDVVKAAAIRERLLKDHPDAPVTADDVLRLAAYRSRQNDHAGAARLYDDFLRRWPDSPSRCVALRNVASELDVADRPAEAAARYLAFGRDERCARVDASITARALVRAGRLLEGQARTAYEAATSLEGVTDPEARKQVSGAKKRLKGL